MNLIAKVPTAPHFSHGLTAITSLAAVLSAVVLITLVSGAEAAPTAVLLGTADSFGVLAGAGVTNTGPTTINGDIGTFPTTSISGTSTMTITGTNHGGDAVAQGAKSDLVTAYNTAAGEGPTSPITADLAGQTLVPGVYNSATSLGLTGTLTLDAGGDPNAVFVFQAGSTLTTSTASQVNLTNGAQACNVFWQIGSSATLGTASTFRGTVIALSDITLTTGATVEGRLLARNGAVTLDTNTITKPTCTTPVAPSTPDATTTTTTSTTTTTTTTTAPTPTAVPPAKVTTSSNAAQSAKAAIVTAAKATAAKNAKEAAARTATTKVLATKASARSARAKAAKLALARAQDTRTATAKRLATAKARSTAEKLTRTATLKRERLTTARRKAATQVNIGRNAKPPIHPSGFTG